MARVVAFGGVSGSGKTTLIEKLVLLARPHYEILVIKHDPKNKAEFDTRGKDSYRFFHAGADVVLSSEVKSAIFLHERQKVLELCARFSFKDFIFIEGYKDLPLPRICVARRGDFEGVEDSRGLDSERLDSRGGEPFGGLAIDRAELVKSSALATDVASLIDGSSLLDGYGGELEGFGGEVLDLNAPQKIFSWIQRHAKEVGDYTRRRI